ncbi:AraC family transcriptional regulator [Thermodesulforhabdus norvegica]|uniref:AraC-type DNA-binding protein n=1 Tax=Thermodesulforhabdus norvegica TaxID=39841 RepID=A0A1I4S6K1_9BACT|nr:AraC family transcriptional regulator [Thermodesulforhabdus norvegica]SFM60079.1 AraC-type DNA-binding protein [Thermodesulforhabdus norvegica]
MSGETGSLRALLIGKICGLTEKQSPVTPLPGLTLSRIESPTEPTSYILPPSICLSLQGAKRVLIGNEAYTYNAESLLITSLDLPVTAQVVEASEERPYVGITWEIDMRSLTELIVESGIGLTAPGQVYRGMALGRVTRQILDAFRRLVELVDEAEHAQVLAPIIRKEILYRLLTSPQGPRLIQIALSTNRSRQIAKAVTYLKKNFQKTLKMRELASFVGMSTSSFYQHFKTATGMSPLQYQKKLRLCEARRLLLAGCDVTTAAFKVGYESSSQFTRDYRKFFGLPPSRDAQKLQNETYAAGELNSEEDH